MPSHWASTLARRCLGNDGKWVHFPFAGGVAEQPDEVMRCIELAWRVWYIGDYLPAHPQFAISPELDESNRKFMRWVLGID